jgi:dipeptidase D
MPDAIRGLKPAGVWNNFASISKIPRGSGNEAAIAAYVIARARELGYEAVRDRVGNVVVRKPASPRMRRAPGVVLQCHMDMVCEKNGGKVHDFLKDPIELVRKGNFLTANGTTLGADNGIAVATNLAILEDQSLEHGPLEMLFTVDEETGLTGAANLAPGLLKSRMLLNLDSEEEGALYVGCSGGIDSVGTWMPGFRSVPAGHIPLRVSVKGLRGGHSGLEIDKGRANAIKLMNRVLIALGERGGRLASIDGGNKRNAIPRECEAVVFVPKKNLTAAMKLVSACRATFLNEFRTVEPDLKVAATRLKSKRPAKGPGGAPGDKVVSPAVQKQLAAAISALPHGVIRMSADIPGLVETSTNVAVIATSAKGIVLATSQRSSVASEIGEIAHTVASILRLGGAKVEQSDGYPGWKPNLGSKVLNLAKKTYRKLNGKDPAVKAIHAGLECGIIGEKYPGIDMVSFGPTLEGVHSPDERIHIDTVDKFWKFLLAILRNVN